MEQATRSGKRQNIGHSKEAIVELISEYKKGGRTVKEFCSEKGIKPGTFHYWLSKQRNSNQKPGKPAFVPVTIKEELLQEKVFVEYKGLKFYQPMNVEFLKALID
jgi:transposase-like protein